MSMFRTTGTFVILSPESELSITLVVIFNSCACGHVQLTCRDDTKKSDISKLLVLATWVAPPELHRLGTRFPMNETRGIGYEH